MKKIPASRLFLSVFAAGAMVLLLNSMLSAQQKKEPQPIASTEGETPGISIEVTELKRVSGGIINLKFTMINDSDHAVNFEYSFVDRNHEIIDFGSIGGVHLIDAAGKKKYFVVRDSEKRCVCSQKVAGLQPKSRVKLWAKFPAPPDDVQKITVVIPHFQPMDDVPISR